MFNTELFGNIFVNSVYLIKFNVFSSEELIETKLNLIYRKLYVGSMYWPHVLISMWKGDPSPLPHLHCLYWEIILSLLS